MSDVDEELNRINTRRNQIAQEIPKLEEGINQQNQNEQKTKNLESQLHNSLSKSGLNELKNELNIETQEGQQNLDELKQILNLQEDTIKTIAHVVQEIRSDEQNTSAQMNDIDSKIKELKNQAEKGNVDPHLAARVFVEISSALAKAERDANIENNLGDLAEGISAEINESHKALINEKQNEVQLRNEISSAEKIAEESGIQELERFIENKEAPTLERELNEVKKEIDKEKGEEKDFNEVMTNLAQEGELTEEQLDKLIAEEQSWAGIMKQSISDGSISARNLSQGLSSLASGTGSMMSGAGSAASGLGQGLGGLAESEGASDMLSSIGRATENLAEGKKAAMEKAEAAKSKAGDSASKTSS